MKDWDHLEWLEDEKARKAGKALDTGIPPNSLNQGEGDEERAKKIDEEKTEKRGSDSWWYGTP